MFQLKARLVSHQRIKGRYFHCGLKAPGIARMSRPGQFVMVKVDCGQAVLLRRPFSIHRATAQNIEILYEALGPGTKILSQRKRGEYLDLIGPLGHGFDYNALHIVPDTLHILVAGGMGVAPLIFLAEKLKKGRTLVLIGAKTKDEILCEKEFLELGGDVKISTDDGSRGMEGKVTDLLKQELSTVNRQRSTIYACGPRPMLEEISRMAKKYNLPAQVSLEEHMACGIGACLGCAVETQAGLQRACKEGPVFNAREIIW